MNINPITLPTGQCQVDVKQSIGREEKETKMFFSFKEFITNSKLAVVL